MAGTHTQRRSQRTCLLQDGRSKGLAHDADVCLGSAVFLLLTGRNRFVCVKDAGELKGGWSGTAVQTSTRRLMSSVQTVMYSGGYEPVYLLTDDFKTAVQHGGK